MGCVTSSNFSIKVNWEGMDILNEEGVCDKMIQYLSRILKKIGDLLAFKYHPMCKHTKLTHLVFVDDLMLFYKDDMKSFSRLMEALTHFSDVTANGKHGEVKYLYGRNG